MSILDRLGDARWMAQWWWLRFVMAAVMVKVAVDLSELGGIWWILAVAILFSAVFAFLLGINEFRLMRRQKRGSS